MNSSLFFKCLENPEKLVDPYYCHEELIISPHAEARPTPVMALWAAVRDRLTATAVALRDGDLPGYERHIVELDKLLQTKNANFLEFTSFFPALDVSYSNYKKLPGEARLEFLDFVTREYLQKRHYTYLSHGYSPVTVQVRRDFEKHKGGGSSARRKLDFLLPESGYTLAGSVDDFFSSNSYLHADGAVYHALEVFLRRGGLRFLWRANHQNKLPDAVIHRAGNVFIMECKHLKEVGGGQDKQLSELIDFVRQEEPVINARPGIRISYVSFLDGVYFNELVRPRAPKMAQQKRDIVQALEANPNNYFVNTWGLQALLM